MCNTAESVLENLLCLFYVEMKKHSLFDSSGLYLNSLFSYIYKIQNLIFICSDSVLVLAYWYS